MFLATVLLSLIGRASSANPALLGEWRSDHDLTMNFLRSNVRLKPNTDGFLDQFIGNLTLTISENQIKYFMPDMDVGIQGKTHHMVGINNERTPYKILYASKNVIVVSGKEPVAGHPSVTTFNFDGPDIMWIYTGGADKAAPDSHFREYFRRIH